jgi:hypothetical protein
MNRNIRYILEDKFYSNASRVSQFMRHTRLVQGYSYQAPELERSEFPELWSSRASVRKCYTPMNIQAEVGIPKERRMPVQKIQRPNLASDVRKLHDANIQRDLMHRILMARQQGDMRLLQLLETELQDLVAL